MNSTVINYLQSHTVVTLATKTKADIWAAAVYYVNDGYTLYFLSAPHTRHCQHIAQNPLVAATIQENYQKWTEIKGIQLQGVCSPIKGAERDQAIQLYAQKFPIIGEDAPSQITQALDKIGWFKIVPTELYFIDNSKGLGHREQIV